MTVERELAEIRVYFFGDSICFGQFVSPHLVWITRLSAALESDLAPRGLKVLVQNPSINGNTSRQGLERAPYDFQAHKPDFVFVQFGMNDCHYWDSDLGLPRVSPEAFRDNMIELIHRGFQHGAKQVFVPTNHPTTRDKIMLAKGRGPIYEDSNRLYAGLIREAATAAGATLVDTRAAFERTMANGHSLSDLVLPDGLHLGTKGHALYFEVIHPVISAAVHDYAKQDVRIAQ